jgi:hypothetical protein
MKIFLQILLSILLILAISAGVLWGVLTFFPPASEVPEYAQVAPEKLICGMENHYTFSVILPLDDRITSAEIFLSENAAASGVHKEAVKWKFDRVVWQIYGTFRVLENGGFPGGKVELKTSEGKTFTVKIPSGEALILPDETAELSVAPLPDIPVEKSVPFPWQYAAAAAVALAGAGAVVLIVIRRRKKVLPPGEAARQEILKLNRMVQVGKISPETGIAGLADTVRNYLFGKMENADAGMTSAEFLENADTGGVSLTPAHRIFLTGFFNCADMVKFAGKKADCRMVDNFAFEALEMISDMETVLPEEKR